MTEAARSGWTGGANCNHGGYVSQVAKADDESTEDETDDAEAADEAACEEVAAPEPETPLDPTAPNSHGAWVSWVAGSEATGGKNCNHGGAVSEAAKKDHEVAKKERGGQGRAGRQEGGAEGSTRRPQG